MKTIDYMKVIDIISMLFGGDKKADLTAHHEKETDIFDIKNTCADKTELSYRILLQHHNMVLLIEKQYFKSVKFPEWISRFEYEMEQTFYRNIKIDINEEATNYRINITF
jgi:hypothetical protein